MKKLDPLTIPLEGRHLIEASAGTGKTYTITNLYLRLLLEKELAVDQILVVTYTNAATQELKGRIRNKIKEALTYLKTGGGDSFLEKIFQNRNKENDIQTLTQAIQNFDDSAIFTIHGFCQRVLQENAFESNALFSAQLLTDQQIFVKRIVEDFWRKRLYSDSYCLTYFTIQVLKFKSPDLLAGVFLSNATNPNLNIVPDAEKLNFSLSDLEKAEESIELSFSEIKKIWKQDESSIIQIFENNSFKGVGAKTANKWFQILDVFLKSNHLLDECEVTQDKQKVHHLYRFSESFLKEKFTGKSVFPTHIFFEECETFLKKRTSLLVNLTELVFSLKTELYNYLRNELAQLKARDQLWAYDDLLTQVWKALDPNKEGPLASILREKYRAALIDEFQDTDLTQYEIFVNIFSSTEADLPVFFIGDPKQAIYAFRGADIHTYLTAASKVNETHTLGENWRSSKPLIQAVNTLFDCTNKSTPFVFDTIQFDPVAHPGSEAVTLESKQHDDRPFQIWYGENGKDNSESLNKAGLTFQIVKKVVKEIDTLYRSGDYTIGEDAVTPGDIAVLTRSHFEIDQIKEKLKDADIPYVVHSSGNVFDSQEAGELQVVLEAILSPENTSSMKIALSTELFGKTGNQIDVLFQDDTKWHEILQKFKEYQTIWNTNGFLIMFNQFSSTYEISQHLVGLEYGERRLTNLRHLLELLHETSQKQRFSPRQLVEWLTIMRNDEQIRSEKDEHLVRLETDENAVKLVTIHASKGLQYPIVFCPFLWDGGKVENPWPVTFHEEGSSKLNIEIAGLSSKQSKTPEEYKVLQKYDPSSRLLRDFEHHQQQTQKEALAEHLRLIYVALTRAQYRCYLVAISGKSTNYKTSGLAYLLHHQKDWSKDEDLSTLQDHPIDLADDLKKMVNQSNLEGSITPTIAMENLLVGDPDEPLTSNIGTYRQFTKQSPEIRFRPFTGNCSNDWSISSFSSITKYGSSLLSTNHDLELPNNDPAKEDEPNQDNENPPPDPHSETKPIFQFPKGSTPGTCLHTIFEKIEFNGAAGRPSASRSQDQDERKRIINEVLNEYNYAQWEEPILKMVNDVLGTRLPNITPDFSLSQLDSKDRLTEMGFWFPCSQNQASKVKAVFQEAQETPLFSKEFVENLDQLHIRPGMLKGFIDLLFRHQGKYYIVDWKSNHLGNTIEDYQEKSMFQEMEKSAYTLQYILYTVAVHRFLKKSLKHYHYDDHFGGAFYLFIRGMTPQHPEYGIYYARPEESFIQKLSDVLSEGEAK